MTTAEALTAEIVAERRAAVLQATQEAYEAGFSGPAVTVIAKVAGEEWDEAHPTLAARLPDPGAIEIAITPARYVELLAIEVEAKEVARKAAEHVRTNWGVRFPIEGLRPLGRLAGVEIPERKK